MSVHFDFAGEVAGGGAVFHVPEANSPRLCGGGITTREKFVRPRTPRQCLETDNRYWDNVILGMNGRTYRDRPVMLHLLSSLNCLTDIHGATWFS